MQIVCSCLPVKWGGFQEDMCLIVCWNRGNRCMRLLLRSSSVWQNINASDVFDHLNQLNLSVKGGKHHSVFVYFSPSTELRGRSKTSSFGTGESKRDKRICAHSPTKLWKVLMSTFAMLSHCVKHTFRWFLSSQRTPGCHDLCLSVPSLFSCSFVLLSPNIFFLLLFFSFTFPCYDCQLFPVFLLWNSLSAQSSEIQSSVLSTDCVIWASEHRWQDRTDRKYHVYGIN